MSIEILRCLKRYRDIGRKAVLSDVETAFTRVYLRLKKRKVLGGAVLSRSSRERALWVRALAGDMLCSWARHLTLTLITTLYTQEYKWVLANS